LHRGRGQLSKDWSEDYASCPYMEATCNNGGQGRSASFCPIVLARLREPLHDGPGVVGAADEFVILEGHGFMSSTDFVKDPNSTVHFIDLINEDLKARGIVLDTIILDTDNCCAQYKCGKAIKALRKMGKLTGCHILQMHCTPAHNKARSDAFGALTKSACRKEEAKPNSLIPQTASKAEFATALVNFCNNGSLANPHAAAAQSHRRNLKYRKFYDFGCDVKHDEVRGLKQSKFIPRKDIKFGVVRKLRDSYCFFYDCEEDQLYFRNVPCGCDWCDDLEFADCENQEYVSAWTMCRFKEGEDDTDEEGDDDDTSAANARLQERMMLEIQERTDLEVETLVKGQYVAVLGPSDDKKYKFYIMKLLEDPSTLDKDVELKDASGVVTQTFEEGECVLYGQWFQWSKSDKGRKADERLFEATPGPEGLGYVYSNVVVKANPVVQELADGQRPRIRAGTNTISITTDVYKTIVQDAKDLEAEYFRLD
jgi:hypothetical protein